MRSTSAMRSATSAFSAARSEAELLALADWTASSRIRCRLLVSSPSALSEVWAREMPSLALRTAWFRPRICVVKRSEIARPAASSLALLIRRPVDSRSSDVFSRPCDWLRLRCALSEATLVLIDCVITYTPSDICWSAAQLPAHHVRARPHRSTASLSVGAGVTLGPDAVYGQKFPQT